MISLQSISLLDLLPPNMRNDPTVSSAAQAIDAELLALTSTIYTLSYLDRLDELTDAETDALAWQYHVDFYDPTMPLEQRRELVKNSYKWHRRKGTPSAVEELIAAVFGSGTVQEWFEYGGQPYHFKVLTNDPAATNEGAARFLQAVNSVKNTRSWLESIEITTEAVMDMYYGGFVHIGDHIRLEQAV